MELTCEGETHTAFGRDDALEAFNSRQVQENARIMRVILDDQQDEVALHHLVVIVLNVLFAGDRQDREHFGRLDDRASGRRALSRGRTGIM